MLYRYEHFLSDHHLPPVVPWDGTNANINSPSNIVPLELDGSFTAVYTMDELKDAIRDYWCTQVAVPWQAEELMDQEKAPFSYRFWGFMKWAWVLVSSFQGNVNIPEPDLRDWDGTVLSPIGFLAKFNIIHYDWHLGALCPEAVPTPFLSSTAGQYCRNGSLPTSLYSDFILFHKDLMKLWTAYYVRTGQSVILPINAENGWPPVLPVSQENQDPSTWTEPSLEEIDPWVNNAGQDTDMNLFKQKSPHDIGYLLENLTVFHGFGHIRNNDFRPVAVNNYSPRFYAWHRYVDMQRFLREPRFSDWDKANRLEIRVFHLVHYDTHDKLADYVRALTIVRQPAIMNGYEYGYGYRYGATESDSIYPPGAVSGWDKKSGAGTIAYKFFAADEYSRPLKATFTAEVFQDAGYASTLVESVEQVIYIGGQSHIQLATSFCVSFAFERAFSSDDPNNERNDVSFKFSRIRMNGKLEVADGSDPGWVHHEFDEIYLLQEKQPPSIEVFANFNAFSSVQLASLLHNSNEARFENALVVVLQDGFSASRKIRWPSTVADEVKGLILGRIPAAGLFYEAAHSPVIQILKPNSEVAYNGLRAELRSGPHLESLNISSNYLQRFTYFYDIVFDAGNDAFGDDSYNYGNSTALARIRIPAYDRSGNKAEKFTTLTLLRNGLQNISWIPIDMRVFIMEEGGDKFGCYLDEPTSFMPCVIKNLNVMNQNNGEFEALPEDSTLGFTKRQSSKVVYYFALAKVMVQPFEGFANVSAYFRMVPYTSTNIVFDRSEYFRAHNDTPLFGYNMDERGRMLTSIPFFASRRVDYVTEKTTSQKDKHNRHRLTNIDEERYLYFGVFLDVNQDDARVPRAYIPLHPDGPFSPSELLPIRNIIKDVHQSMVIELRFHGDYVDKSSVVNTTTSASWFSARNLVILQSDEFRSLPLPSVQSSFLVNLMNLTTNKKNPLPAIQSAMRPPIITNEARLALIQQEAMQLRWSRLGNVSAEDVINARYPLVWNSDRASLTTPYFDELLIQWPSNPSLPRGTYGLLYFPSIAVAECLNLRAVRHAPKDSVRIQNSHTLYLDVPSPSSGLSTVSYVPMPYPMAVQEIPGILTIHLPDNLETGQHWEVTVLQIRGSLQSVTGGFQIFLNTSHARQGVITQQLALLSLLYRRFALTPKADPWYKILEERVRFTRERAQALANATGETFDDPTMWEGSPVAGRLIRVVLDEISLDGDGEVELIINITSSDNGGQEYFKTLYFDPSSCGHRFKHIDDYLFEGYVEKTLHIEINAVQRMEPLFLLNATPCQCDGMCYNGQYCKQNTCTSTTGYHYERYRRLLVGDVDLFVKVFSCSDESPSDPEMLKDWSLIYHIEYA